jgi:hypothetical protein
VTASGRRRGKPEHPWREIDLDVYERHMSDARVGQLQRLHDITAEQLTCYPSRTIGVLGIAGGNGLDLVDPETTDAVYGYDINPGYLAACETRYRKALEDRLHLIETSIDRSLRIEPVDLLIANLIIEYIGTEEFVAFVAANAGSIGVLSCVTQRNDAAAFVSTTDYARRMSASSVRCGSSWFTAKTVPGLDDVRARALDLSLGIDYTCLLRSRRNIAAGPDRKRDTSRQPSPDRAGTSTLNRPTRLHRYSITELCPPPAGPAAQMLSLSSASGTARSLLSGDLDGRASRTSSSMRSTR